MILDLGKLYHCIRFISFARAFPAVKKKSRNELGLQIHRIR